MTPVRRLVPLVLLVISLAWLFVDAPGPFLREAWFVTVVLGATLATRSVSWNTAFSALGLGIGVAAPAMIALGWLLAKAGFDLSQGGAGSWAVVPIVEELLKIAVVLLAAWLYRRRARLTFNPSDWLLVGCSVGAGFAMVENAQLVANDAGVMRDMARQYGPWLLVPGAWGTAGYVGHAAATGLAAGGVGLSRSLRRTEASLGQGHIFSLAAIVSPIAWITLEHVLANLRVDTGSGATSLLGNGRLTPWLFLAFVAFIVYLDVTLARRALAHSSKFRERAAAVRTLVAGSRLPKPAGLRQRLLVAASERRLLNAAAWVSLERLLPGKVAR